MRILFVAASYSVHMVRWISQLEGLGWDIHLFPVEHRATIHPELRELTLHDQQKGVAAAGKTNYQVVDDFWPLFNRNWPLSRGIQRARRLVRRKYPHWHRPEWRLARTIDRLQPDAVHSLGIQHGGYLTFNALEHLQSPMPPWIISTWGSDIYLFGKLAEHEARVRGVLERSNYFSADCHRDLELARQMGFSGEEFGIFPGGGGFDLQGQAQFREPGPTSARRVIMLKGYQHWAGRALVGLRAIERCADLLRDYRIVVYSAFPDVVMAAELAARRTGLQIDVLPESAHEDILRLHGKARISVGLSISDGTPNSMLEAMTMGSFPIQSHTSCANEWVTCGESALLVHPEDSEEIAGAIGRAIADDALVDRAAEINARVVAERIDESIVRPQVIAAYQRIGRASASKGRT
jgi:glycosyltransferase involved in cell wall biosynthesis